MLSLAFTVLAGFVTAPLCGPVARLARDRTGWIAALVPAAIFASLLSHAGAALNGGAATFAVPWIPDLGVVFSLRLDGLALLFALLISGIGALVLIFAGEYMRGHDGAARLLCYLLLFMAAMLGVVLADNVLTLFVFWELTSITSYLLIGFDHHREKARKSALQALLVTGLGGLALLVGLVLLGREAGSFELSAILASPPPVDSPYYGAIVTLVLAGCFTKSAQFPFHFWLPSAMEAPTPVSAYLHSSTMVKAGIYLLARLDPALGGTRLWQDALLLAGAATVVAGTVLALRQTAFKRLLAYSTVASLGTIVMLLGLGTAKAAVGAMTFLLAHGLYKGALFLVAGTITHATEEKEAEHLAGLRRALGAVFAVALLAGISMAGLIPTLGFIGKEIALEASLVAGLSRIAPAVLVIGAAGFTLVAFMVAVKPFVGALTREVDHLHQPGVAMLLGPAMLGALGLAWGLAPGWGAEALANAAATAIHGSPLHVELKLWHGWTLALGLSALGIAAGVALFAVRTALRRRTHLFCGRVDLVGPEAVYDRLVAALIGGADRLTRTLQNERLRTYSLTVFALVAVAVWASLASLGTPSARLPPEPLPFYIAALAIIMVAGGIMTAAAQSRIPALVGLGLVGIGVAGTFSVLGAPDLAMTQISADALTIVLLLLALRRLPDLRRISMPTRVARDLVVALAIGAAMTALTLLAATLDVAAPIAIHLSATSVPEAFGRNVVNVILVDFRALDTLGEITVVATAALGVFALLAGRRRARENQP